MSHLTLFAEPWWVNLFIFIPFTAFYFCRKYRLCVANSTLVACAFFGSAFGFVEAAVVVYLRAAVGLLPGYGGTLGDVARLTSELYQKALIHGDLPESLWTVEIFRETATMVMLLSIAFLGAPRLIERTAIFLWTFALWDICYYLGLFLTVGWPPSLLSPDVLFLIPVPWLAQVWFPILVSSITLAAVLVAKNSVERTPI
jgi:hypothetical protein